MQRETGFWNVCCYFLILKNPVNGTYLEAGGRNTGLSVDRNNIFSGKKN
jgi:hypothetical protein